LKLNIMAVFVFDGPQKPPFKRNKRTTSAGGCVLTESGYMKSLIQAFGFVAWDAPGEAEAECSALQKRGVVDVVLTEDVDSVMFGATKVAREIADKNRTHVMLYSNVDDKVGLDRDGLVFIAMASGGDYLPEGIHNCGAKKAAEVLLPCTSVIVDCPGGVRNYVTADNGLRGVESQSGEPLKRQPR
jgi:holliday junction resolvase GEN1/YEN1